MGAHREPRAPAEQGTRSPDPDVSTAFVLGWELASILRSDAFGEGEGVDAETRLLRFDSLSPQMRAKLTVALIESNVHRLGPRLSSVKHIESDRIDELRLALAKDEAALRAAIKDLHLEALFALAAADSKLGRAYAVGYELADICFEPRDRCSLESAFGIQVVPVKDRLADLASSFPPHSSRAVVLSLRAWELWTAEPKLGEKELSWDKDGAGVRAALHRQGALWRDLLAGDKNGRDMLDTGHYVKAASSLVATMGATLKRFARPIVWPLLGLSLLFIAGIALLATGSKLAGAILTAIGALGITGASIRARLGSIAGDLQSQLWGAELDVAIAQAVLTGPADWGAEIKNVPASGAAPKVAVNMETLCDLRKCIGTKSPKEIGGLLAPDAEFVLPGGSTKRGAEEVADWLCEEPQSSQIASEPARVDAVAPGILVSRGSKGGAVWRVREGKVRWREGFDDGESALKRALALGPQRLARETRPSLQQG